MTHSVWISTSSSIDTSSIRWHTHIHWHGTHFYSGWDPFVGSIPWILNRRMVMNHRTVPCWNSNPGPRPGKFRPPTGSHEISVGSWCRSPHCGPDGRNVGHAKSVWVVPESDRTVQGGSTEVGGGVPSGMLPFPIICWFVPGRVVLWSRDSGKQRTVQCKIWSPVVWFAVWWLRPRNRRSCHYFHSRTDPAWTIRISATNDMEFPVEAVVTPYEQFFKTHKVDSFNAAGPQSYDWGIVGISMGVWSYHRQCATLVNYW